jgi:hypothetical protein
MYILTVIKIYKGFTPYTMILEMCEERLEQYRELLENAVAYYTPDEVFIKYFNRIPKSRYHTFNYCFNYFETNDMKTMVELGTSRSFVDGRFPGCNLNDTSYWQPNNPSVWDWSAGCFTKVAATVFENKSDFDFYTVDIDLNHIQRCQRMNENSNKIKYVVSSSEEFLSSFDKKIDMLYLDTGDMTPIEYTAQLHLREAKIIVERDLMSNNGIILIDDIRSVVPYEQHQGIELGKGYLSIPYFLQNGFKLIMDEYQTILVKE